MKINTIPPGPSMAESPAEKSAANYIAKMPPAISGSGGHKATFSVACKLREFGLNYEQAFRLFMGWNEKHCQPQWTERELHHKLTDAFRRTSPKGHFDPLRSPSRVPNPRSNRTPVPSTSAKNSMAWAIGILAKKLSRGTEAELNALATMRGLSIAGIALASDRGLLRFGELDGHPTWFILDSSCCVIQARRMDGHRWMGNAKAWILTGSRATWPVGIGEAQNFPTIALCEGGPDLLAACQFVVAQGRVADCAPVAMLSAAYNIPSDALPLFSGKRVMIYAHDDQSGYQAASRWMAQLKTICADVDSFSFAGLLGTDGVPVKDLNGFARSQPEDKRLLEKLLP